MDLLYMRDWHDIARESPYVWDLRYDVCKARYTSTDDRKGNLRFAARPAQNFRDRDGI